MAGMQRVAPPLTTRTGDFWRSGTDGVLRIAHCRACGLYMHPPQPLCARCHSTDVGFDPVSGQGRVYSFTINRYQWKPGMPPPYVIADVELAEQSGLMVQTNIVGVTPEEVAIGMTVTVEFEQAEDTWIPVFRP
jgi:uncharacterized OB-fold protein